MSNIFTKFAKAVRLYNMRRTAPLRLEINLTQACNLNCKGCTHYSALAPKDNAEDLSTVESNLAHLATVKGIDQVKHLYLIGGETLLYPHLVEAIEIVRRYFPATRLSIFTNGILIPRMGQDFWDACRTHNVEISITRYPINVDYDALQQTVRDHGVAVEEFADRKVDNSFFRFPLDPKKQQNARKAHFTCFSFGCLSIIGDRLFPCSQSGCIDILNSRMDTEFEHLPGDYIKIADITDVKQIKRLRDRPVPFCAYCKKPEPTKYGPSKRNLSEWL